MRPGSGQRSYLGSEKTNSPKRSRQGGEALPETDFNGESSSSPTEFDITRLLPSWTLVVRQLAPASSEAAAYIHFDAHTGRPHLIGRRQGQVVVSLVARRGDVQPLTTATIEVGSSSEKDTLEVVAMRAECVDYEVRLSGQLTAAPISVRHDDRRDPWLASVFSDPVKSVYDLSLPRPHKLTVELAGISTGSGSLITAAASSTPHRLLSSLRSSASKLNIEGVSVEDDITSSATCPIHRLAVSLLLSDGSLLSTHLVPRHHLRIAMLNSPFTWDPAVSFQPAGKSAATSKQSTQGSDNDRVISPEVLINRLIVWPGPGELNDAATPLAAMDEVAAVVKKGLRFQDPGSAKDPLQLMSVYREAMRSLKSSGHKILKDTQRGIFGQNQTRTSSGDQALGNGQLSSISMGITTKRLTQSDKNALGDGTPTIYMICILLSVGGFAIIVILVNVGVCYTLRRNKHKRIQRGSRQGADGAETAGSEYTPSAVNEMQRRMEQNLATEQLLGYPDQGRYNCANNALKPILNPSSPRQHRPMDYRSIPCITLPMDVGEAYPHRQVGTAPMAGGLSCSSVGSGNSCGRSGSFKQSLNKGETVVNPYLIASDVTSSMAFGQTLESAFGFSPPHSLMMRCNPALPQSGLTVSGSWSPPPEGYFNSNAFELPDRREKQTLLNSLQTSVQIEGALCSPINLSSPISNSVGINSPRKQPLTSLFSAGDTDEGCSDEGVASGAEVCNLSTELVNRPTLPAFDMLRQRHRPVLGMNQISGATSPHHTAGSGSTVSCGTSSFAQNVQSGGGQQISASKCYSPPAVPTVHSSLSGEDSSVGDANERTRASGRTPHGIVLSSTGLSHTEASLVGSGRVQQPIDYGRFPQQRTDFMQHSVLANISQHQLENSDLNVQPVCQTQFQACKSLGDPDVANPVPQGATRYQVPASHLGKAKFINVDGDQTGEDSEVESFRVSLPPMMKVLNYRCPTDLPHQHTQSGEKASKCPDASDPPANALPSLYKRSDSFGMATKQMLPPVTMETRSEFPSPDSLHQASQKDDSQGMPLYAAGIRSTSRPPFSLIETCDEMVGEVSDATTTSSGSRPYGDSSSNEKAVSKCHINLTSSHEVYPVNGDLCDVKPIYIG